MRRQAGLALALSSALLLSSCRAQRAVKVEREPMGGDGTELVLRAERTDKKHRLSADYSFSILGTKDRRDSFHPTQRDAPVVLRDLPPGAYEIVAGGRRLKPRQLSVVLLPGERTRITIRIRHLRGMDAAEGSLRVVGDALRWTGIVIGTAALLALYVWLELTFPDEEDDDAFQARPAAFTADWP